MITGVTGKPGHGKTLQLTWLIGQYVSAGRKVVSNIELLPACPFYDRVGRLDEDVELKNARAPVPEGRPVPHEWPVFSVIDFPYPGYVPLRSVGGRVVEWFRAFWHFVPPGWVVVVSEASNYWDSLDFATLPKEARFYWNLHRKFGHTVILDYQNIDNLYNRLRRVTETFIVCDHNYRSSLLIRLAGERFSRFWRYQFSHEALRESDFMSSAHLSWKEASSMFGWYRTDQLYGDFANTVNWSVLDDESKRASSGTAGGVEKGVGERSSRSAAAVVASLGGGGGGRRSAWLRVPGVRTVVLFVRFVACGWRFAAFCGRSVFGAVGSLWRWSASHD